MKDLMRELRSKAACWEDIGVDLQVNDDILAQIKHDNRGDSVSCLRDMFRVWLKQVDPRPSWSAIVEAVDSFDQCLASELKTKYCSNN